MIGKLKGKIEAIDIDHLILDVNGVGYLVYCSGKTLSKLSVGDISALLIETHVREDQIRLYGFCTLEEKSIFLIMQSVKGVGARMSLVILSHLTPEEICLALNAKDKDIFNSISGIGKKLAERIITELKDQFISKNISINIDHSKNNTNIKNSDPDEAISALINLGINRMDAQNRVNTIINNNPNFSIRDIIYMALQNGKNE